MATIVRGVAIRPTVSLNRRRYTPEMLRRAHRRLAARLADPNGRPVTMRLFHPKPNGADASVEAIAGHLTTASIAADGTLSYEAELADTPAGRTASALLSPGASGRQHLANVSIRGYFLGDVRRDHAGNETADDMEIDGLDLTDTPGVQSTTATLVRSAAGESAIRRYVCESVVSVNIVESRDHRLAEAIRSNHLDDLTADELREVQDAALLAYLHTPWWSRTG